MSLHILAPIYRQIKELRHNTPRGLKTTLDKITSWCQDQERRLREVERIIAPLKSLAGQVNRLRTRMDANFMFDRLEAAGMSGNMELDVSDDEDVAATALNAAAASSFKKAIAVSLVDTVTADPMLWANFTPVLTPAVTAADGDIVAPSVTGTPVFDRGKVLIELVFDTDEGSTKTYEAGDEVTLDVQVKADDTLLGWPVAMKTITFTIV